MHPNRESYRVATRTVKPSVVVVPTCNTPTDNRFTRGGVRRSRFLRVCCDAAYSTSSRTMAWNPESNGKYGSAAFVASLRDNLDTACGDGACDPHRATKTSTTRTATSACPVHHSPTKTVGLREGLRRATPFFSFYAFGAGASESRTQTRIAQQREVCLLAIETEGRVSGGDRAITFKEVA